MKLTYTLALAAAVSLAACDAPLEVDPETRIPTEEALNNAFAIKGAVNGAYSALQTQGLYDRELTAYPELYADNLEFTGTFTTDLEVDLNSITTSNGAVASAWTDSYAGINRVNEVLAAIPGITDFAPGEGEYYEGQARFLRALNYFNLVRYFGRVPLVLQPTQGRDDIEGNTVGQASQAELYARIVTDLDSAVLLLGDGTDRGRANAWAAKALLSRVHLERGDWQLAYDYADDVIRNGPYELVDGYRDLFEDKHSSESIFEITYTINDFNNQAFWALPSSLGGRLGYAPESDLVEAYEEGDERLPATVGVDEDEGYYGRKFWRIASNDDNVIVIRLAEMYLNRAEAALRLGRGAAEVRADIDVVRERAGLEPLAATVDTQAELIQAIADERRVEFALEGYRLFDLRRLGLLDDVLGDVPALFPIPQGQIDVNPLLEQNEGY